MAAVGEMLWGAPPIPSAQKLVGQPLTPPQIGAYAEEVLRRLLPAQMMEEARKLRAWAAPYAQDLDRPASEIRVVEAALKTASEFERYAAELMAESCREVPAWLLPKARSARWEDVNMLLAYSRGMTQDETQCGFARQYGGHRQYGGMCAHAACVEHDTDATIYLAYRVADGLWAAKAALAAAIAA